MWTRRLSFSSRVLSNLLSRSYCWKTALIPRGPRLILWTVAVSRKHSGVWPRRDTEGNTQSLSNHKPARLGEAALTFLKLVKRGRRGERLDLFQPGNQRRSVLWKSTVAVWLWYLLILASCFKLNWRTLFLAFFGRVGRSCGAINWTKTSSLNTSAFWRVTC